MSDLLCRIRADRKILQRTSKKDKLDTLRYNLLTTLVGEAETALKGKQAAKFDMLTMVKKFYTNVEDTLAIRYTDDLHVELCILNEYIPAQLTEDEIREILSIEVAMEDLTLGRFMGYMNTKYKGRFDGKMASDVFKMTRYRA